MGTQLEFKGKENKEPMKRKILFILLALTISSTILAGCKASDSAVKTETTETTIIESEVGEETENVSETTESTEQDSLTDEITDNIVYPDVNPEDVDPKTTNMDADTARALGKQALAEICDKYGSAEAFADYAISQGADGTMGWCWVYYTGQGAGSEESYAVYMKEGSARYGEVFHLGDYLPNGTLFTGANIHEHGIADDREFQRMYENGEFGDGLTIDENGDIIIE